MERRPPTPLPDFNAPEASPAGWLPACLPVCGSAALTVNLQHGGGLRLAHAVLRRARVRPLVLLFHPEQPKDVAVVDLEPGS